MPKVTNISANQANDIVNLPANTVLISINEEYENLYELQMDRKDERILTVKFSDVTGNYKLLDGTIYHPISDETVLKILDFINIHKGKDILIHCAAGVSRSGAIALYLHLFHDYELKTRFWELSKPNPFVLGKLIILKKYNKYAPKNSLDIF